jgi:glycosyltransferase involved in cell wall biosynthesis
MRDRDSREPSTPGQAARRFIYIACPWTPKGGGMFKVADYLIQSQSREDQDWRPASAATLLPLDTRGDGNPASSMVVLVKALGKLVSGRRSGQLAGVHVNMAERLSLFRKSVVVIACRALGLPVVLHLHAAQLHHFYAGLPRPLKALTRWVFSLPDSCVVLGHQSRRFVVETLGVDPNRVNILINGVPEPTQPRRKSWPQAHKRVLFVGNLSERKGVSDLLEALALAQPDPARVKVRFAGGGDVAGYTAKAAQLGLADVVRFEGWCDQDKVAQLMARADLLVLPSYDEGLPLVILEALANGVAVVCTPVGEIPSVLRDGVTARFVKPGDRQDIADALMQVLGDADLREALERQGRALYEETFSLARFFAGVAHIHQRHFGVAGHFSDAARSTDVPRPAGIAGHPSAKPAKLAPRAAPAHMRVLDVADSAAVTAPHDTRSATRKALP